MIMDFEEIVERAQNGDKKSEEEIIFSFKPLVKKYARTTFISGLDENDFIQIGYLTIIKAIKNYDKTKSKNFTAYICFALRNNFYYEIRQKCRYNLEISLNKPIAEELELGDEIMAKENIEEEFIINDIYNKVVTLIKALPVIERELIEFIYINDGSLKNYSKLKNINYAVCAKRKERILKKLREMLCTEEK